MSIIESESIESNRDRYIQPYQYFDHYHKLPLSKDPIPPNTFGELLIESFALLSFALIIYNLAT